MYGKLYTDEGKMSFRFVFKVLGFMLHKFYEKQTNLFLDSARYNPCNACITCTNAYKDVASF